MQGRQEIWPKLVVWSSWLPPRSRPRAESWPTLTSSVGGVSQHLLTRNPQWPTHVQLLFPHSLTLETSAHPKMNKDRACDLSRQLAGANCAGQAVTDWRDVGRGYKGLLHYNNKWVCFWFSSGSWNLCHSFHTFLTPTPKDLLGVRRLGQ